MTSRPATTSPALKDFAGIHRGERCFLIGNGPSLASLDLTKLRERHEASGAKAEVTFRPELSLPPVINDLELTHRAVPLFEQLVGKQNVKQISLQTTADDFSFFSTEIPSIYFWVGVTPRDKDPAKVPFNHSPLFYLDEAGLITGVRAMLTLTTDFLAR